MSSYVQNTHSSKRPRQHVPALQRFFPDSNEHHCSRQREAEAHTGPEGIARCDFGEGHGVAEHCQDRSNAYAGRRVSNALN
jgi:hypothetical protein